MIVVEILLFWLILFAVGFFVYKKATSIIKKKFPDPISKLEEAKKEYDNLLYTKKEKIREIGEISGVQEDFYQKMERQTKRNRAKKQL